VNRLGNILKEVVSRGQLCYTISVEISFVAALASYDSIGELATRYVTIDVTLM
jgi:hypothetical protein